MNGKGMGTERDYRLGRAIRDARVARGLSVSRLAAQMGVEASVVCNIEGGKNIPRLVMLGRIAEPLGTTPEALISASRTQPNERPGRSPTIGRRTSTRKSGDPSVTVRVSRVHAARAQLHAAEADVSLRAWLEAAIDAQSHAEKKKAVDTASPPVAT